MNTILPIVILWVLLGISAWGVYTNDHPDAPAPRQLLVVLGGPIGWVYVLAKG